MSDIPKLTLSELLLRTPVGDSFFTETKDTVVASYAYRAGVKITTERMLAIHPAKREIVDLTRVTVTEADYAVMGRKPKTIAKTIERVRRSRAG